MSAALSFFAIPSSSYSLFRPTVFCLTPVYKHRNNILFRQCATGSKILTEPEPDRIGIILAGTGPDYKPEKVNWIRPDWPG